MLVAAIDVGSNAIRFVCAEFAGATEFVKLVEERVPVRLGHDVFLTGKLATEAAEAALEALRSFRQRLDEAGISHYRAVATSAVREASNGERFIERVRAETGLELEAIERLRLALDRLINVVQNRDPKGFQLLFEEGQSRT
jgi:exopolyphosphatase / guanosine-5'-triphosphate,3'-diphosphate pyrophosphatase